MNIENNIKKVAIYGNLVVDKVSEFDSINCTNSYKTVGGVGNVCRFIKQLNNDVEILAVGCVGDDHDGHFVMNSLHEGGFNTDGIIQVALATTSRACIDIDVEKMTKDVDVKWGSYPTSRMIPANADWHHFAYLDNINTTVSDLRKCRESGVVSADFCLSKHDPADLRGLMELLTGVDYLIVSDEEVADLFSDYGVAGTGRIFAELVEIGVIIRASSGSCYFSSDRGEYLYEHGTSDKKKGNILGAGDFFASSFIVNSLHTENTVGQNIAAAHCDATRFVVND